MWCCAGRSLVLTLAVAACAADPDTVVTVERDGLFQVRVQLCAVGDDVCETQTDTVFNADEPVTVSHTIGVYLDEPADELLVRFSVVATENVCKEILVPFGGDPRRPHVTLPGDRSAPLVEGCSDCTGEDCTQ